MKSRKNSTNLCILHLGYRELLHFPLSAIITKAYIAHPQKLTGSQALYQIVEKSVAHPNRPF